ncbi:MAG: winged helix-turn-helix domain-containing protein [Burkholderiaceae bacterium]
MKLRPQAMELLCLLATQPNTLLTKEALMAAVWPGMVVTDDSLVQAVGDIRRALGDTKHELLATVPRRGYRLNLERAAGAAASGQAAVELSATPAPPGSGGRWMGLRRASALALLLVLVLASAAIVAMTSGRSPRQTVRPTDRAPIAVLPFKQQPDDKQASLLGLGLAEDLTSALARNSDLRVINALAMKMATEHADDPVGAAAALGLRYVVDGSVVRVGERLRVTIRLNDAADRRVVWTEQQDAGAADLPGLREGFVKRAAVVLHSGLRTVEMDRVRVRPPASMDVYEKTLLAIALKHRMSPDGMKEARRLLEEVTQSDPDHAPGWAYLAMVNAIDATLRLTGQWSPRSANLIQAQLDRAMQLDSSLPAAHFTRSMLRSLERRPEDALVAIDECIKNAPSDSDCLMYRVFLLAMADRFETALQDLDASLPLMPVRPAYIEGFAAYAQAGGRRYGDALATTERCLARAPAYPPCHVMRLLSLVESGQVPQAQAAAEEMLQRWAFAVRPWVKMQASTVAPELRGRILSALEAAGVPQ